MRGQVNCYTVHGGCAALSASANRTPADLRARWGATVSTHVVRRACPHRWLRGYVATWVHDFSNFPGWEIWERGAWVRGYVGTRLFEFSGLGDLGARCVGTWVRGYVGTRLLKLSWPGDSGARRVGTWVRGYTTFQTFLAGRSGRAVREYVGTWVQGFQNYLGHVLVGSSRWRWVGGYKDFETPRGVGASALAPGCGYAGMCPSKLTGDLGAEDAWRCYTASGHF